MITSSFRLLSVTCQLVFRFSVFNAKTHTLNDVDKQNTHGTRCFSVITIGVRCYSAASYTHRVLFVRIFVDGILLHRKKNSSLKWLSAISPSYKWKSSSAINFWSCCVVLILSLQIHRSLDALCWTGYAHFSLARAMFKFKYTHYIQKRNHTSSWI